MGLLRLSLFALSVLALSAAARAARDIVVVVDMSAAGRKLVHPTPQHPAFYLPTLRGYQQGGDPDQSQVPPSPHAIVHLVATELAKQGYLASGPGKPAPQLIIDVAWGYINPNVDEDNDLSWNQGQMYSLVLGHNITNVIPYESVGRDQLLQATKQNRFFIILTAYDYEAFAQKKQHVMLWVTKMSVPSDGILFTDVMEPLVRAGGPNFGVETQNRPHMTPAVPDGKVIVGTPTVKKDPEPIAPDAK